MWMGERVWPKMKSECCEEAELWWGCTDMKVGWLSELCRWVWYCQSTKAKVTLWSVDRTEGSNCKWRKMIKDVRWSGWVWVGECFFWYRPTRVVPDQRPLNGCVCVCLLQLWMRFIVCLCSSVLEARIGFCRRLVHAIRRPRMYSCKCRIADDLCISCGEQLDVYLNQWTATCHSHHHLFNGVIYCEY